jgi:FAD/FMN-containing dehydrogenase
MNEMSKPITAVSSSTLARLIAVVGEKNAITDPDKQAPYLVEFRALWTGHSPVILRPGSTAEVSEILKIANETSTAIVPQGGNTGLVGGQIPHNGEVVLSLTRMNRIREVDPVSNTITCEAGVTLMRAREAAADVDRLYPQLLPSEGTCTIGGNLSTNAGGTAALAHGIARSHALGLEVVLADGRILNNLNKLKKDNTGYDLRDLFIGAEGTLGVITAAVLRLVPRPRSVETAWTAIPSVQAAVDLLGLATERTAGGVTSFEIMAREGIDIVVKHSGARDPLATKSPYSVLIELSSQRREGLREAMEQILAEGLEKGLVLDATICESVEQAKAFWRIRELFGEMQGREGGSIKHDVSVPVANIPAFIEEANAAAVKLVPGARPLPFGHVGDGNIHYNITQPIGADKAEYLKRWDDMNDAIYKIVLKYGGSVSAEHGVGIVKRDYLPKIKDPVAYDLMKTLKRTLDPKGILNPGKVL